MKRNSIYKCRITYNEDGTINVISFGNQQIPYVLFNEFNKDEKYSSPKNLEELFNYSKGEKIEWCSFPDEFKNWESCMYTYEKGLTTSLNKSIEMFIKYYLDEDEIKEVWNEETKTYIFDKLEKKIEEYFPGVIKFLVNNKVSEIIFTW